MKLSMIQFHMPYYYYTSFILLLFFFILWIKVYMKSNNNSSIKAIKTRKKVLVLLDYLFIYLFFKCWKKGSKKWLSVVRYFNSHKISNSPKYVSLCSSQPITAFLKNDVFLCFPVNLRNILNLSNSFSKITCN